MYKYSGSCDRYQEKVISYWNNKINGFDDYLQGLKKDDLIEFLDWIKGVNN